MALEIKKSILSKHTPCVTDVCVANAYVCVPLSVLESCHTTCLRTRRFFNNSRHSLHDRLIPTLTAITGNTKYFISRTALSMSLFNLLMSHLGKPGNHTAIVESFCLVLQPNKLQD